MTTAPLRQARTLSLPPGWRRWRPGAHACRIAGGHTLPTRRRIVAGRPPRSRLPSGVRPVLPARSHHATAWPRAMRPAKDPSAPVGTQAPRRRRPCALFAQFAESPGRRAAGPRRPCGPAFVLAPGPRGGARGHSANCANKGRRMATSRPPHGQAVRTTARGGLAEPPSPCRLATTLFVLEQRALAGEAPRRGRPDRRLPERGHGGPPHRRGIGAQPLPRRVANRTQGRFACRLGGAGPRR
jgi:hypothetical protein